MNGELINMTWVNMGQRKKSESLTVIKPMTSWTPGGSCIHWAPTWFLEGHGFNSFRGLRFFLCPSLVSYWSIHLLHFVTELKIHHLYSLITTYRIIIYYYNPFIKLISLQMTWSLLEYLACMLYALYDCMFKKTANIFSQTCIIQLVSE